MNKEKQTKGFTSKLKKILEQLEDGSERAHPEWGL